MIVNHLSLFPFPVDDRQEEGVEYSRVMRVARLHSECYLILEEEVLSRMDEEVVALLGSAPRFPGGAGVAAVHLVLLPVLRGLPACSSEKV